MRFGSYSEPVIVDFKNVPEEGVRGAGTARLTFTQTLLKHK
jgi:hypothetical protein